MSERLDAQRRQLDKELEDLEKQAGFSKDTLERAWSGEFIPYGALGDEIADFSSEQNNRLYFDSEHDATRRKVRELYFGVADEKLRKALMAKQREREDNAKRRSHAWVSESASALATAKQKAMSLPWETAAVIAAICVALGYWWFQLPGAIGGAVCGFFFGQGHIANKRREQEAAVKDAEETLKTANESLKENLTRPAFFSADEQYTGVEDQNFSWKSAFGDRIEEFHAERSRGIAQS